MHNISASKNVTFSTYLEESEIKWGEDSLLFSSPNQTIIGSGIALSMEIDNENSMEVEQQIRGLLEQSIEKELYPIVIGSLAFDGESRSRFIVPKEIKIIPSNALRESLLAPKVKFYDVKSMNFSPHPETYMNNVKQALCLIDDGKLEKVVLARLLELEMEEDIDVLSILDQLMSQTPSNYVFSLPALEKTSTENSVFVGASPELLVKKNGNFITSNPLAGSIASVDDVEKNKINKKKLLSSEKDLSEHEFARQGVAEILRPFCSEMKIPALDVISAGAVMHLSTCISGTLNKADVDSLTLAKNLHPTPAVCGTPTNLAKQAIKEIESFSRGLYSGMVGWCDASGNGEWAVTLRCAEINKNKAKLYSGAGIVKASCPHSELQETNTKLKTMLNVLGINDLKSIENMVAR